MSNARSDTLTRPVVHGYPLSLEVVSGFVLASDAFAVLATDVAIYIAYLGWSEDRFPVYLMASVWCTRWRVSLCSRLPIFMPLTRWCVRR